MNFPAELNIKIKRIHDKAIIPTYKKEADSGFDLHSSECCWIKYGEVTRVHTGLCIELPSQKETYPFTLELQIRPRSGLSIKEGIMIVNSPGTVDNGYRNEILIALTRIIPGNMFINIGDRIAQGIIQPVLSSNIIRFNEVEELGISDRNLDGWGSTGR